MENLIKVIKMEKKIIRSELMVLYYPTDQMFAVGYLEAGNGYYGKWQPIADFLQFEEAKKFAEEHSGTNYDNLKNFL
jgi:hypothetical protein